MPAIIHVSALKPLAAQPLPTPLIKKIVSLAFRRHRKKLSGELNVIFVDGRNIRRLNRLYHSNDRETDVIAFSYPKIAGHDTPWADIYVSPPVAQFNAKRYHDTARRECARLVIHGLLHLFGYDDHQKRKKELMWKMQEAILNSLLKA